MTYTEGLKHTIDLMQKTIESLRDQLDLSKSIGIERGEKIALLESQLRDKDEEIASWKEERDNVLNDFELYRAEKDKQIEAFKDIENIRSQATKNLCKENYDLRDDIERLKELFEKLGSAMQDLSEQVGLLSNENNELREALSESELQAQVAITGNDIIDSENKQMKIAIKDFLLFIESGKGEYPTILLSRCRKLIG